MRDFLGWAAVPLAFIALIAVVMVMLILDSNARLDRFNRNCGDAGGHIYKPSSISFCLDENSDWIEVYP